MTTNSWLNLVVSLSAMTLGVTEGFIHADPKMPRHTRSITVEGLSHSEHTSDKWGRFKHPFKHEHNAVQSIYYPESGTYSTKLHRKPGPSSTMKQRGL